MDPPLELYPESDAAPGEPWPRGDGVFVWLPFDGVAVDRWDPEGDRVIPVTDVKPARIPEVDGVLGVDTGIDGVGGIVT
jgi:hypothetical protein